MYGSSYVGATQWLATEATPAPEHHRPHQHRLGLLQRLDLRGRRVPPRLRRALGHRHPARGRHQEHHLVDRLTPPTTSSPRCTPGTRTSPRAWCSSPSRTWGVAPWFFEWIAHRTDGPYWQQWAPKQNYPASTSPCWTWRAGTTHSSPVGYRASPACPLGPPARRRGPTSASSSAPTTTSGGGAPAAPKRRCSRPIGPVANSPVNELMLSWWDHYLKGIDNGVGAGGPGSTTSRWARTPGTPPPAGPHPAPPPSRCTWAAAGTPTAAAATGASPRSRPPLRSRWTGTATTPRTRCPASAATPAAGSPPPWPARAPTTSATSSSAPTSPPTPPRHYRRTATSPAPSGSGSGPPPAPPTPT